MVTRITAEGKEQPDFIYLNPLFKILHMHYI